MMPTDSKTSLVNLSDTQPQNQTPSSKSSTPLTTNQPSVPSPLTSPISASSSSSSSTSLTKTQRELELEKEVQRLQNIIKCLKQQNANLLKVHFHRKKNNKKSKLKQNQFHCLKLCVERDSHLLL
jgi:hypothetical protein